MGDVINGQPHLQHNSFMTQIEKKCIKSVSVPTVPDRVVSGCRDDEVGVVAPVDVVDGSRVVAAQRTDALPRRVIVLCCNALRIP